jgi:hypothetical protein
MTRARRRTVRSSPRKTKPRAAGPAKSKPAGAERVKKPKAIAPKPVQSDLPRDVPAPGSPTLRSQAQLEIRLERGARALTATEQAARLASAQMERRIGRLLSRRVKLKFR